MTQTLRRSSAYHHGDLRKALIDAAYASVRRNGGASFSLRDAAKHLGVSPSASYRHFSSRNELLAEVVVLGFRILSQSMRERLQSENCGSDPKSQLIQIGEEYVAFANEEPYLFELMFGPEGAEGRTKAFEDPENRPNASQLLEIAVGKLVQENASETYWMTWAIAHGIAALMSANIQGAAEHAKDAIRHYVDIICADLEQQ